MHWVTGLCCYGAATAALTCIHVLQAVCTGVCNYTGDDEYA